MNGNRKWTDERLEIVISMLLRVGLVIASLLVLAGGIIYLVQHGTAVPEYSSFRGEPFALTHLGSIFTGVTGFDSRAIIQFGLLLLILTPISRVVFSVAAFLIQRDYLYTGVTLFVLAILIFNLIRK